MSPSDDDPSASYLWTRFQRADWVTVFGLAALFLSAVWFVVDLTIEASTAELKADFKILQEDFEDSTTAQANKIDNLDSDLTQQIQSISASIEETVGRGLSDRTDALSQALVARFDNPTRLTINLANISRKNASTETLISDFAASQKASLLISYFADKSVVSLTIDEFHGAKAQPVQEWLDALKAVDENIVTKFDWEITEPTLAKD